MLVKKNYIVLMGVFVVLLAAGLFMTQHTLTKKQAKLTQLKGTLLQTPRALVPFILVGTDDKPFDNASLKGQWTLLFFGFTHCGSVCPTAMSELGKMMRLLEQNQVRPLPKVVMITLDPERDDLARLAAYVKAFHPQFYGARGDNAVMASLTQQLGVAYEKVRPTNSKAEHYTFEHSGAVMLINPQGQLSAFFTMPHKAEALAHDYQLII